MAIVKQYHKDTNTTYVYESESYWDPEKKQSRSRRRVIGKVDPETGEIIPTGTRGRKKKEAAVPVSGSSDALAEITAVNDELQQKVKVQAERIQNLEQTVASLQRSNEKLKALIKRTDSLLYQGRQLLAEQLLK